MYCLLILIFRYRKRAYKFDILRTSFGPNHTAAILGGKLRIKTCILDKIVCPRYATHISFPEKTLTIVPNAVPNAPTNAVARSP